MEETCTPDLSKKYISSVMSLENVTDSITASRDELIKSHLKLVVSIAHRMAKNKANLDDLIQVGNLALINAVDAYDRTLGIGIYSYASTCIEHAMRHYILENSYPVKMFTSKPIKKVLTRINRYRTSDKSLTREQIEELAKDANVDVSAVIECENRLYGTSFTSLSVSNMHDDDSRSDEFRSLDVIDEDADPESILSKLQVAEYTNRIINTASSILNERQLAILNTRILVEGDECPTLHDLAKEFGVSAERVRQIEKQTYEKLQKTYAKDFTLFM